MYLQFASWGNVTLKWIKVPQVKEKLKVIVLPSWKLHSKVHKVPTDWDWIPKENSTASGNSGSTAFFLMTTSFTATFHQNRIMLRKRFPYINLAIEKNIIIELLPLE